MLIYTAKLKDALGQTGDADLLVLCFPDNFVDHKRVSAFWKNDSMTTHIKKDTDSTFTFTIKFSGRLQLSRRRCS
jgi:hypothetical protein